MSASVNNIANDEVWVRRARYGRKRTAAPIDQTDEPVAAAEKPPPDVVRLHQGKRCWEGIGV